MAESLPLGGFVDEWICYLEQHGHQVEWLGHTTDVLVSRNGRGKRYRWLLRCVEGDSVLLTSPDRKDIRCQVRLALNAGEQCFLVVKFGYPGGKAVIMAAAEAIKAKRLTRDKGGIPWDC